MEIFGIGPLELVAILIIIFIVMGPGDMVRMGSKLGRAIRDFKRSGLWSSFNEATRQLRDLPDTLVREVGGEDVDDVRREIGDEIRGQKGQLDELNEQFVAWTREPETQSQKKQAPPESTAEESEPHAEDQQAKSEN